MLGIKGALNFIQAGKDDLKSLFSVYSVLNNLFRRGEPLWQLTDEIDTVNWSYFKVCNKNNKSNTIKTIMCFYASGSDTKKRQYSLKNRHGYIISLP